MNEIVKQTVNLPSTFGADLMKGIDDTRSAIVVGDGKPFFRLLRDGYFVYGQDDVEMQEGSLWAVSLPSLSRGWVCWGDGELLGQVMASVQAPRLPQPAAVGGYQFAEQFGFDMVCISGEDAGVVVSYKNNSYGYKKAFDTLLADVRQRWAVDPVHFWPVITLSSDSYDHKKYGKIFNPLFAVVAWADADGNFAGGDSGAVTQRRAAAAVEAAAPQPEAQPVKAAPRKRRTAAALDAEASAILKNAGATSLQQAEPAPVSTQQAHAGQRRRPAAR